ncbi:MAG: FAD-binding protein [Clostridiales bacterium]|nr:FAD-binding protein [Clostridiales bacterium]
MGYDLIIVGAGPSGIFTAYELNRINPEKKILLIEQGKPMEKRRCPKDRTKECINCRPFCDITTGFSGAGAFSDGKLSLSPEVGGDLPELIGFEYARELIEYTDKIYIEFGADLRVEGVEDDQEIKEIRRKAIEAGLKLVDCPIRHLGTERAQYIYGEIEKYLIDRGIEIRFNTKAVDIIVEDGKVAGVVLTDARKRSAVEESIHCDTVVVSAGRKGADWLKNLCVKHNISHKAGTVDIGVRVEVRNEVMERVNNVLYESKLIGYPLPFRDKVRTFCQNPGGFVSQENYDNNLAVVNGHSYKNRKTNNTNLAILSSHNFSYPFNEPIKYGTKVAELMNMLGDGKILVQRYGDILDGKRTWQKELSRSNVVPTLPDAVAGDLTSAMPYRAMTNILNFIEALNTVVPGFAGTETLLYGPEVKFYSNKVEISKEFETSVKGLYSLGDASGWTRGLMMASLMGVRMGQILAGSIGKA